MSVAPVGVRARHQILEAALLVLRRDGYHALSMRRVARESAISVGNLTYHYPSKKELIEAVIDHVLDRYAHRFARPGAPDSDPVARLCELIDWLIEDSVSEETSGLFRELWVLARHEPHAAESMGSFYDRAIRFFVGVLEADFPDTSRQQRYRAAYLLCMLSEGANVVFGDRTTRSMEVEDLLPVVKAAVLEILLKD